MIRGGSLVYIKIREKGEVVNGYDQKDLLFHNQQRAEVDIPNSQKGYQSFLLHTIFELQYFPAI